MIEIACIGVVRRVSAEPEGVWRQRRHSDHPADPIIGRTPPEQRSVSAIMLNHEKPHEKASGREGQQQTQPIADAQRHPHQRPKRDERRRSDREFEDAARDFRFTVTTENLGPAS